MKLSPPASSSDLDAAREVARRLKLIATPPEPTRPLPDYAPLKGTRDGAPVPPRRPAPAAWEPASPTPVPAASVAANTPQAPPTEVVAPPPVPPAPVPAPADLAPTVVVHHEPPPPEPEVHETPPPPVIETVPAPPVIETVPAPPVIETVPAPPVIETVPAPPVVETVPAPPPPVEVEAPPAPSVPPAPTVAPPLPAEPPRPVAPEPPPAAAIEEVEEIEEDLSPDEPSAAIEAAVAAPITWPEIVATCLSLAEAKGALVINPEGRVVAVSGDWPSPGAEAIAARLVPAMDKALKDAPTRSVSVPLGGVHLTAWRAPMAQGLVTVGFVADAPLRPDLRPAIDAVVRKGS